MNVVVVQGVLSREPQEWTQPDGVLSLDWQVTTGEVGDRRTVPVRWIDPPAAVRGCEEGADVLLFGSVHTRWFRTGGVSVSRVEVVADAYANPKRAASVARLHAKAEAAMQR